MKSNCRLTIDGSTDGAPVRIKEGQAPAIEALRMDTDDIRLTIDGDPDVVPMQIKDAQTPSTEEIHIDGIADTHMDVDINTEDIPMRIDCGGGSGGGGSGTNDYNELIHKPQINGTTLIGNKTWPELDLNYLTNLELEALLT